MMKKFIIITSIWGLSLATTVSAADAISIINPLGDITDIPTLSGRIIAGLLSVVGALALVMFVWGGILWMTSGGNTDRVQKGKQTLVWSTIGLFVIFASYSLLRLVLDTFTS